MLPKINSEPVKKGNTVDNELKESLESDDPWMQRINSQNSQKL
jgi:hypothetical protein